MRILITAILAVLCLLGCNVEQESVYNGSESNRLTEEAEARLSATEGGQMVLRALKHMGDWMPGTMQRRVPIYGVSLEVCGPD